ncbi:hypothetical protein H1R20_g6074, partial [Candolleomyces eurysporus]
MPTLSPTPPEFSPKGRYTQERMEGFDKAHQDFWWPEERKLMHHLMAEQNEAFAWTETERGKLREDFFKPVRIATVPHTPWVQGNRPIAPFLFEPVCEQIRSKIEAGVYEPSSSSYRSRWFCVLKKDGKSLRIVHSLEPLNAVTIAHSGLPPNTEELASRFAGRSCGTTMDLYVGYDERVLDERSRDLTTFQTPFGAMRLVTLPMGWTNSVPIFHEDITAILQPEIPHITEPFVDDVPVKGPLTRYELPGGGYETIPENPGIRRFVWEHIQDVNRVIQRMKYCGGTFSGKKTCLCMPEFTVPGHQVGDSVPLAKTEDVGLSLRPGTSATGYEGELWRGNGHHHSFRDPGQSFLGPSSGTTPSTPTSAQSGHHSFRPFGGIHHDGRPGSSAGPSGGPASSRPGTATGAAERTLPPLSAVVSASLAPSPPPQLHHHLSHLHGQPFSSSGYHSQSHHGHGLLPFPVAPPSAHSQHFGGFRRPSTATRPGTAPAFFFKSSATASSSGSSSSGSSGVGLAPPPLSSSGYGGYGYGRGSSSYGSSGPPPSAPVAADSGGGDWGDSSGGQHESPFYFNAPSVTDAPVASSGAPPTAPSTATSPTGIHRINSSHGQQHNPRKRHFGGPDGPYHHDGDATRPGDRREYYEYGTESRPQSRRISVMELCNEQDTAPPSSSHGFGSSSASAAGLSAFANGPSAATTSAAGSYEAGSASTASGPLGSGSTSDVLLSSAKSTSAAANGLSESDSRPSNVVPSSEPKSNSISAPPPRPVLASPASPVSPTSPTSSTSSSESSGSTAAAKGYDAAFGPGRFGGGDGSIRWGGRQDRVRRPLVDLSARPRRSVSSIALNQQAQAQAQQQQQGPFGVRQQQQQQQLGQQSFGNPAHMGPHANLGQGAGEHQMHYSRELRMQQQEQVSAHMAAFGQQQHPHPHPHLARQQQQQQQQVMGLDPAQLDAMTMSIGMQGMGNMNAMPMSGMENQLMLMRRNSEPALRVQQQQQQQYAMYHQHQHQQQQQHPQQFFHPNGETPTPGEVEMGYPPQHPHQQAIPSPLHPQQMRELQEAHFHQQQQQAQAQSRLTPRRHRERERQQEREGDRGG